MERLDKAWVWLLAAVFTGSVQATLIDRGEFDGVNLIYDTDQNITWLQDANWAKTSGADADGKMSWSDSNAWAAGLTIGGFTDWRLPTIVDRNNDGCNWGYNGTDCGYNVDPTGSEMAYIFYLTLGNTGAFDTSGNGTGCGGPSLPCLTNTGPFINLQADNHWSSTEYGPDPTSAWRFSFRDGGQDGAAANSNTKDLHLFAWAVRDGDVAVPAPSILAVLALGLCLVVVLQPRLDRRRQ